jgi:hypothetical protein
MMCDQLWMMMGGGEGGLGTIELLRMNLDE